ncbi:MAG: RidA family protein [Gammaproteobacteria bacterium]
MSSRRNISSGGAYESIFGYSRAVRIGSHVHVSGTCAPPGHENSDAYMQARAALDIIGRALSEAGATFSDVVRTVVYVKDISDADLVAKAHCEYFGEIRPASTLIQMVSALRPWQRVEIEAYAILQTD